MTVVAMLFATCTPALATSGDEDIIIEVPRDGWRVCGSAVSVVASPNLRSGSKLLWAALQYKPRDAEEWIDMGKRCQQRPYAQRWDTTVLDDAIYDIRCIALKTDEAVLISDVVSVTVDNTSNNHDVIETVEHRMHRKTQKITPQPIHITTLYDGSEIAIPASERSAVGEWVRITVVPPGDVAQPLADPRNASLLPLKIYRRVDLASGATRTTRDIAITIPYPDRRISGIDEWSLCVYYYNEETQQWEDIPSVRIFPAENLVIATTTRVGLYSIGGSKLKRTNARCFIAAAACGAPMARELWTLCHFRDKYLLRNCVGRYVVAYYYRHSPPVANYLYQRNFSKSATRWVLKPIIWCVKLLIAWQESDYYETSTHC
jgi:hypothetical protein